MKQRPAIPNTRLLQARLHRHWSQREVAAKLGTSFVNVSRWERGITIPGPYFRQQLCVLFDTSPQELGLLLDQPSDDSSLLSDTTRALQAPNSALWYVPFPRNPFFTGRATLLQSLHELLQQNTATALTQSYALHGLGGIGKTQIALEYMYRYARAYTAIFWVSAETFETLLASFVTLANILDLTEQQEPDQNKIVRAVVRWLSTQKDWLLVCDNVEDIALLQSFLPSSHQGSVLLTTRLQAVGTLAQQLSVEPLTREEGLTFLLQRAKLLPPGMVPTHLAPADVSAARTVVEAMDGLPLALDQVGAYIEETQCGLESYLQQYHQRRARLLERRGHSSQDHLSSVYTTLSLSFQQVEQHNPTAVEMLQFCAFPAPEAIPEEVLSVGLSQNGAHPQAFATDPWLLDECLAVLGTYSLIHRDAATKTLSLHRLVQAVLQDRLSEHERRVWFTRIIAALHRLFPEVEYEMWQQCGRLVPHVLQCAKHAASWEWASEELATLLIKTGTYLMERAQYQEAEELLKRAVHMREQVLGEEHSEVADPLNTLGRLYNAQGQYREAEGVLQRAVHIREQALGPTHFLVSHPLNNLGVAYNEQGKYQQAEPVLIRALAIREQALGATHPKVALPLDNLGITYYEQLQFDKAEPLFLRALSIHEQAPGGAHPQMAYVLTNLGLMYSEQTKYVEAEAAFTRAIQIREQALGIDHPQVAYPLSFLGKLYSRQGRHQEAEQLLWRALHIKEQALGTKHPDIADSLYLLACFFLRQGDFSQAESYYQQAMDLWAKTQGLAHPLVVTCIEEYAQLAREQAKE